MKNYTKEIDIMKIALDSSSIPYADESVNRTFEYDGFYRLTKSEGKLQQPYNSNPAVNVTRDYSVTTSFDDIHNIKTKDQTVIDHASRPVSGSLNYNFTYSYDYSIGGATKPHAPHNITNNMLSPALIRGNTYDYDGNLTQYTEDSPIVFTRSMTWDNENRLRRSADNMITEDYYYDESGQRVIKQGADYTNIYTNQYYNATVNGSNTTENKHILAGNQRIVSMVQLNSDPETLFYYQTDHLGSTGYLTNATGTLQQHTKYTPWGESWFENPTTPIWNYKFTGKEQDATDLYYFGARYYDPRTSVWINPDPILNQYIDGENNGGLYNAKNLGLYSYCQSNPVKLMDPDGNAALVDDIAALAVGAILGGASEFVDQAVSGQKINGGAIIAAMFTGAVASDVSLNVTIATGGDAFAGGAAGGAVGGALGSVLGDVANGKKVDGVKALGAGIKGVAVGGALSIGPLKNIVNKLASPEGKRAMTSIGKGLWKENSLKTAGDFFKGKLVTGAANKVVTKVADAVLV